MCDLAALLLCVFCGTCLVAVVFRLVAFIFYWIGLMPPAGKKRGTKVRDSSADLSSGAMGPPPPGKSLVRHLDSELSGCDVEVGKRFKPGSPLVKRAEERAEMETDDVIGKREVRSRRKKPRTPAAVVLSSKMADEERKQVLSLARRYEVLLTEILLENSRLKGQLEVYQMSPVAQRSQLAPAAAVPVAAAASAVAAVAVPKVPETWSAVVRARDGRTPKEIVDKVRKEVAPEPGTRVHELKETRNGAIIRVPSVAERRKVVESKKFEEVGLEVSFVDKLGPKVVMQQVHTVISADEFIECLYSANLAETMTREAFSKGVLLVSSTWKVAEGAVNVTLECTTRVAEHLRATGVYCKWFRFCVRLLDVIPACHRCYGFDHRVRECRFKEEVCRLCGQGGHIASRCTNPVHCRNCALRRQPADYPMVSLQSPVYAMMVARANARH